MAYVATVFNCCLYVDNNIVNDVCEILCLTKDSSAICEIKQECGVINEMLEDYFAEGGRSFFFEDKPSYEEIVETFWKSFVDSIGTDTGDYDIVKGIKKLGGVYHLAIAPNSYSVRECPDE